MNITWVSLRTIMAWSIVRVFFHLAIDLAQEPNTFESTSGGARFWLALLHNNDGETQLINAGSGLEDFGGVARFTMLVRQLKQEAAARARQDTWRHSGPNNVSGRSESAGRCLNHQCTSQQYDQNLQ